MSNRLTPGGIRASALGALLAALIAALGAAGLGGGAGVARAGTGGATYEAPSPEPERRTQVEARRGTGPLAASTPHRAYAQGDSLVAGTVERLPERLRGWRIKQSHGTGRTVRDGVRRIAWRARRDALDSVIVVSLGTNDSPLDSDAFRSDVRELLEVAGRERCVVWANIVRPRVRDAPYDDLNAVLADEALRRPNLVLVDWVAMTRAHPDWLRSDGVHAAAAGYDARASAFAAGARWCVDEDPGWWGRYLAG